MTELIDDLDAAATLAAAEAVVLARRVAELEVGGDGSPWVQELCLPELAIARGVHTLSLRRAMADALDLRHRLPRVWAVVEDLQAELWVARKVAALSRRLDRFQVAVVDAAVSAAIGAEAPSRVLAVAEAKVIEADRVGHEARLQEELRRRFVGLSRVDARGMQTVIARVEAGEAHWVDSLLDQVADLLGKRPDLTPDLSDGAGRDELRAVAFGWLSRPDELAALLSGEPEGEGVEKTRRRRGAVLYVHLHQAAVEGIDGVGRVEAVGPQLLEQVTRTLGHSAVTLRPVLDLTSATSVNAYEFPESVKERVHLRTPGETFPHASRLSRLVDLDHPTAWESGGPPGQTGDHNVGPLSRTHHRAKTHLGYRVTQVGLSGYLWSTPHGLHRYVDPTGTRRLTFAEAAAVHP